MGLEDSRTTATETKQESILEAALTHFLKHGYTRAAMADIAREADVSTATLYKYYASKEELFSAITQNAAQAVPETVGEMPESATVMDICAQLLYRYHAAQQEGRVNDLLRIVIAEANAVPELARGVFKAVIEMRYRNVKGFLDMLVARNLLKPHDTELGARLVMGMIKELFVWPALFDQNFRLPHDAMEQASEAVRTYLALHGVDDGKGTM